MNKMYITAIALLGMAASVQAQLPKIKNPVSVQVNNPIPSTYSSLMSKDMSTVMKELKLSAKDTIGKTGNAVLDTKTGQRYSTLKTATGETLGFLNNKLSLIVPKKK